MLNAAGLSLDQAPPIAVPFRFFLTAPLFACAAGLILVWEGDGASVSRWTPPALAVVHLVSLGFLTQVMCGALFQMLPVLAGAPVPAAVAAGRWTHGLLLAGTVGLCVGFVGGGWIWLTGGAALVTGSLAIFLGAIGRALAQAASGSQTVKAMRLSLAALAVTLGLGLTLVAYLSGWVHLDRFPEWVDIHLAWGLLGWAGILIMAVGYQVVPMFHVTPPYPRWMLVWSAPLAFLGLTVALALTGIGLGPYAAVGIGLSILSFVAFGLMTLGTQLRRQRRRVDATLLHWWIAIMAALAAAVLWLVSGPSLVVGVLALFGVGVGLPSGMLFKIVPFLCWFHLQSRQVATQRFDYRIPTMHGFLAERAARFHVGVHVAALVLLISGASIAPGMVRLAGLTLAISSALLAGLLAHAAMVYRRHAAVLSAGASTPASKIGGGTSR
jgi:hypothetical protein